MRAAGGVGTLRAMSRPRALFFGTPTIAVPSLDALHALAEIVGVVCQPDKPAGRGLALTPPPVKVRAAELGLEIVQPAKVRTPELAAWARERAADFALVIAYGRILPKAILEAPRLGCWNLHASLLPELRGAAPITWAIARGAAETGICLMQMDEGMDTGPVLARRALPIDPRDTAGSLSEKLGALAAEVVREDVPRALRGELAPVPQDHARATMAPMLEKEHGRVDWSRPAADVDRHVRAMTPWPGATARLPDGRALKLLEARPADGSGAPGLVLRADKRGVVVACGEGALAIERAQVEGKRPALPADLVNGRVLAQGAVLG